jgi:hypothetical protein
MSATAARVLPAVDAPPGPDRRTPRSVPVALGWIPALVLASGLGLALVAIADARSRTGNSGGETLLWLGMLVLFVPVFLRQLHEDVPRGERVTLVLLLAGSLYLVKVMRDPFGFAYADELVHQHNVQDILHSQQLFGSNPILAITPDYPGLESVTAALSAVTGLSSFVSGLLLVGAARLMLVLTLFLLAELAVGSARVAGAATALYVTAPHFLFFDAQFSYQSLALPLVLLAVLAALRSAEPGARWRGAWTAIAVAAAAGVVVTHHMSSYALVAGLAALCVLPGAGPRPWRVLAVAAGLTLGWLVLVASGTVDYLRPVLDGAFDGVFQTATGSAAPRRLFQSSAGVDAAPLERITGVLSASILLAALPVGLLVLWHRPRRSPLALLLGIAAAAYIATLGLRLVPSAWETGVRASSFLFPGMAVVAALTAIWWLERMPARRAWAAVGVLSGILLAGGVIGGASSDQRTAHPYRVAAGGAALDPPAVAAARWARANLGPGNVMAAEPADARILLVQGGQRVITGTNPPIERVLQEPQLERWQVDLLRRERVRYLVSNADKASADVIAGYYWPGGPLTAQDRFEPRVLGKWRRAGATPVYAGGGIVIYDLERVLDAPTGA